MAQPSPLPVQGKTFPMPLGQAMIAGRIYSRRKIKTADGSFFLSVIKLPAADAFSHPLTVEVRSHDSLGNAGEDWSGAIRVNGYPRSYDTKPDADGVISKVATAQNILEAVEG